MNKHIFLCALIVFVFSACSPAKQEIIFDKPKINIPKKQTVVRKNKGSLYSIRGASLFADKKDLQVGDIIQINISEKLKQNSKNKRELTSNRNNNLGGALTTPSNSYLNKHVEPLSRKFNSTFGVGISTKSSTADKGEVKTTFDEDFTTTISAIIEETYANGNYFIKGFKEILIDGQKQKIIISGVIRPYDITPDNAISSSQMANLKIMYDKEGQEADILQTPWGLKLIRLLWPF